MAGEDSDSASRLVTLLERASLEVTARDPSVGDLPDRMTPGSDIFISLAPGQTYHQSVAAAVALRRAGYNPVPHLVARNLANFTQLREFVERLAGEAGVTKVLVVGGDGGQAQGPFAESIDLMQSGVLERNGIRSVGIAGHPEGSARIARGQLEAAFDLKIESARILGFDLWIATQFCFEAAPILGWIHALRARGIEAPIRIGIAGPATVAALLKFAIRCGIGNSLRALRTHADSISRLLGNATPDALVRDLAGAGGLGGRVLLGDPLAMLVHVGLLGEI